MLAALAYSMVSHAARPLLTWLMTWDRVVFSAASSRKVECIHVYLAVFAWFRLVTRPTAYPVHDLGVFQNELAEVTNVNLRTAMGAHFHILDGLEGYMNAACFLGGRTLVDISERSSP